MYLSAGGEIVMSGHPVGLETCLYHTDTDVGLWFVVCVQSMGGRLVVYRGRCTHEPRYRDGVMGVVYQC